ncbi:MAG: hypothetical protein P1U89_16140 [Verrucomicrobiales bacterium]|nr:hypothetical protein [Verrucomicrobiales bacterium]
MSRLITPLDYILTLFISAIVSMVLWVSINLLGSERPVPFTMGSVSVSWVGEEIDDRTSRQSHCHIHQIELITTKVPFLDRRLSDAEEGYLREKFPFGRDWVSRGTCGLSASLALVSQCTKCCEERRAWEVTQQERQEFSRNTSDFGVIGFSKFDLPESAFPAMEFEIFEAALRPVTPEPSMSFPDEK